VKFWKNEFYSVVNSKENVKIVVKLGTNHSTTSIVHTTVVEIMETEPEQIFTRTVANLTMIRSIASNSRRKKLKMAMPVILTATLTGETTSHKMWFSRQLRTTRS
jgi:hypothetical protein